jgi:hypothetical protein
VTTAISTSCACKCPLWRLIHAAVPHIVISAVSSQPHWKSWKKSRDRSVPITMAPVPGSSPPPPNFSQASVLFSRTRVLPTRKLSQYLVSHPAETPPAHQLVYHPFRPHLSTFHSDHDRTVLRPPVSPSLATYQSPFEVVPCVSDLRSSLILAVRGSDAVANASPVLQ